MNYLWTIDLQNVTMELIDQAYNQYDNIAPSSRELFYMEHINHEEYFFQENIPNDGPTFAEMFSECCLITDLHFADRDRHLDESLRSLYLSFEEHYLNSLKTAYLIDSRFKELTQIPPTEEELSWENRLKQLYREYGTQLWDHDTTKQIRPALNKAVEDLQANNQPSNRTTLAYELMLLLDKITVNVPTPPYRKYLIDFEERNLGRSFFCFDMNLLEAYCQRVINFMGQIISKLQFHIYKCITTTTYDSTFTEYIEAFTEAIKESGQSMNPYTNPKKKDCMALVQFQCNGNSFYEHAFSNMFDCNVPTINTYFNLHHSKEKEYKNVSRLFENMVSIKSHWARTNLNMPTYYDFADETKLLDHPATISDAILPLSNASNARSHFNCCERKILSDYDACLPLDQVNCVKVFARHPICYKCVPCIIDLLCQKQHLDIYMYYLEDSTLQCKKLNIQSYWMNLFHKNALKNELIAQKYRDMVK